MTTFITAHALELARGVDAALRARANYPGGPRDDADELRAVADRFSPVSAARSRFHCRTLRDAPAAPRGRRYLIEVRQCVDNDGAGGAPGTPLDCATVQAARSGLRPIVPDRRRRRNELPLQLRELFDRLRRHRRRDVDRPAVDARRPPRVLALACLLGDGHGARRRAWNLLRAHLLPAEWTRHTRERAVLRRTECLRRDWELSLGLLLGRLTGRKTPGQINKEIPMAKSKKRKPSKMDPPRTERPPPKNQADYFGISDAPAEQPARGASAPDVAAPARSRQAVVQRAPAPPARPCRCIASDSARKLVQRRNAGRHSFRTVSSMRSRSRQEFQCRVALSPPPLSSMPACMSATEYSIADLAAIEHVRARTAAGFARHEPAWRAPPPGRWR